MNSQRRRAIREFAENVRTKLQLRVPVDVDDAVTKLGGVVRIEDETDPEALVRALGPNNEHKFEVVISNQVAVGRHRFSVAHEIGHLFLHMGFMTSKWNESDVYKDNVMYRFGYSQEEAEANEFAGTLLMPETEFRAKANELDHNGSVNLVDLATHFQVSPEAARLRGCFLGLFAWDR